LPDPPHPTIFLALHPGSRAFILVIVPQQMQHPVHEIAADFILRGGLEPGGLFGGHLRTNENLAGQAGPGGILRRAGKRDDVRGPGMGKVLLMDTCHPGGSQELEIQIAGAIPEDFFQEPPGEASPLARVGFEGALPTAYPQDMRRRGRRAGRFRAGLGAGVVRRHE
jgi:hypothetical protein